MTDRERELLEARLEGFKAAVDLLERIERAKQKYRPRVIYQQQKRSEYDWTDWVCGIPLIDKLMGIK